MSTPSRSNLFARTVTIIFYKSSQRLISKFLKILSVEAGKFPNWVWFSESNHIGIIPSNYDSTIIRLSRKSTNICFVQWCLLSNTSWWEYRFDSFKLYAYSCEIFQGVYVIYTSDWGITVMTLTRIQLKSCWEGSKRNGSSSERLYERLMKIFTWLTFFWKVFWKTFNNDRRFSIIKVKNNQK